MKLYVSVRIDYLACEKTNQCENQHDKKKPSTKAGPTVAFEKFFENIHWWYWLNSGTKLIGRFKFDGYAIFANPHFLRAAVSFDTAGRVIACNDATILTMPDILELVYFCFA